MRCRILILAASLVLRSASGDILVTAGTIHTGQVVTASASGVAIKVGENEFTLPLASILRAEITKPDVVEKSLGAFRTGKYSEALTGFKFIAERYTGLALPWIEESVLRLGDTQFALKDYAGAKKAYETCKTYYPDKAPLIESKFAQILFAQGQSEKAQQLVEAVIAPLLKRDYLTDDQESAVADGLILLGDCLVVAGKSDEALDAYLKVVTLFDVDSDRTLEAKYKAAKLFEVGGKWRRAKQSYDEVLKENPAAIFAEDAKRRLAELSKNHPD